ncbi:MAG: Zn-dependent alcohol dehydrogenase [Deltaproteobacteria bacterium]|nr:Zn-dependent alcohol dehydrogenase [Deltaproteobacteria bacterium]MBW2359394.1 Zn-dependent alcohol dehydrogenase [Deltaproteobacteria bacterium]
MKALVCTEPGKFSVENVTLDPPKTGEIRVKMGATGVCRSDLSVINGVLPLPPPVVLGHEGAGTVAELGHGVNGLEVGDHVILSFVPCCGSCDACLHHRPVFCSAGVPDGRMIDGTYRVHQGEKDFGTMQFLGCMAEECVVPATAAVKIDKSVPFDKASLVGCGVMTGVGAAINTAQVTPGSTCVVFGCGGVGLSVIQGCRISGADRIIAVDVLPNKLEMAKQFGATDAIDGSDGQAPGKIHELTGGGADYAFEAVGVPALMEAAYASVRSGGTAVLVGVGSLTQSFSINALMAPLSGKTIKGSMYGDANPHADFPRLLGLYQRGKLDLDAMVTRTYSIDDAPQAFTDMEKGVNARGVIVF